MLLGQDPRTRAPMKLDRPKRGFICAVASASWSAASTAARICRAMLENMAERFQCSGHIADGIRTYCIPHCLAAGLMPTTAALVSRSSCRPLQIALRPETHSKVHTRLTDGDREDKCGAAASISIQNHFLYGNWYRLILQKQNSLKPPSDS